ELAVLAVVLDALGDDVDRNVTHQVLHPLAARLPSVAFVAACLAAAEVTAGGSRGVRHGSIGGGAVDGGGDVVRGHQRLVALGLVNLLGVPVEVGVGEQLGRLP